MPSSVLCPSEMGINCEKKQLCSSRNKVFPLRIDPISRNKVVSFQNRPPFQKGHVKQEKKQGAAKVVSLDKNDGKTWMYTYTPY